MGASTKGKRKSEAEEIEEEGELWILNEEKQTEGH